MSLSRLGILKTARAQIANPIMWHQGCMYGPYGSACAAGAIVKVCNPVGRSNPVMAHDLWTHLDNIIGEDPQIPYSSLPEFNDHTSHAAVLALFDWAIEEMSLPGKSKTITVEPIKTAPPAPKETPAPIRVPDREKVPA